MLHLYENVREIVAANQLGPKIYLYPIYTYYSSLLSDKIKLMTERIFEQDTIPKLPVIVLQFILFFVFISKRTYSELKIDRWTEAQNEKHEKGNEREEAIKWLEYECVRACMFSCQRIN